METHRVWYLLLTPQILPEKKKKHNRKVKQFEYKLIFKRQVTGQKWAAHLTPLALPHLSILEVPQNTLAPEIPSLCNTCDF